MSRDAVEKVLKLHTDAARKAGHALPNTEKLRKRIVDVATRSDKQRGKDSPGKER